MTADGGNKLNNPKVSVLLLAYNQRLYIAQALLSVLSVDYDNVELIISDDASQDGTAEIIDSIVAQYKGNKSVIVNKNSVNMGIGGHINKLLKIASGDLIVFAAGDDVTYKHRVARIVEEWVIDGCKADAICSSADVIDPQGKTIGVLKSGKIGSNMSSELKYFFGGFLGCTEAVTKRMVDVFNDFSNEVIGGNSVISEDRIFAFRAYVTGGILCIPDRLVAYRVSPSSVSNNMNLLGSQTYEERKRYRLVELSRLADVLEQCLADIHHLYSSNRIDGKKYLEYMTHIENRKKNLKYQMQSFGEGLMSRMSAFYRLVKFHEMGVRSAVKLLLAIIAPRYFMVRFY